MNKPAKVLAVLIVEDSESDAQLIVRLLKKADYELVYKQVETAEQMRAALKKYAWDIVISDYKLPQFDGRAALKLLQEMGRDIPFIVVSGTIGEEIAVAMMKAGAHDYLIKGDLARLVPAVERELNQAGIRRERKRAVERFELIKDSIDAASDGVYWMDREGWFIYVNDAGCKALGYSRDELLQIRVFDVNPRATAQRWAELWQVLRDKKVFTAESVHRRKDGSEFPVELTSNYIKFGGQEYVNEFARDINERVRAEEALRESEERYHSLFDRMLDGVYRSTHAGKFVDINPAMVKMFGYSSKEEMLEIDIKKELYFDPAERGSHILDTGQQEIEVYRMRRKDGSEIWVEDRGYYVHDEQGRIVFHEGMLRDVTEQVRAKDALAASEAELRALFASMQDVVLVIDHDGVYRKIAPTNPGLLVKSPEELLGRNLRDVFPAEQAETLIGTVRQVLDTKQTTQIEYELLIGDRTVWFETSISPMDKDSTLWVARDVSGRRQAEEALHESEERFRSVFENVTIGLYRTTPDAHILLANTTFARMLGCESIDELMQRNKDGNAVLTEYPRGKFLQLMESEGEVRDFESYGRRMDGTVIFVRENAKAVRDSNGKILYFEGFVEDITERKRAEEALRESEERFHTLYDNATVGLYRTTPDGRILMLNPAGVQMLGFASFDEIAQRDLENPEFQADYPRKEFREKLEREGTIFGLERKMKKKDGSIIFVRESAKAFRDENGKVLYYDGSFEDVTKRVRAEEALSRRAEELTALQATVLDISSPHPLPELLNLIVERAANLLDASSGGLYLTEPEHRRVRCLISYKTKEDFTGTLLDYGVGAAGYVAETGKPIIIDDYRSWSGRAGVYEDKQPFQAVMSAPLLWQGKVTGVIHLLRDDTSQKFTQEELNLLLLFANHAAVAVENARLFDMIRQRVVELETLYESGLAISQLLNPKEIGQKILELLEEKLDWHHTTIRLYHPNDESLELLAFNQPGVEDEKERLEVEEHFRTLISKSGEGLSGWAVKNSQTVRSGDVGNDSRYVETFPGLHSGLYVPMKLGERMIGVISIESEQLDAFSEADERLVTTLANQAASAFENARLFEVTRQRVKELETLYESGLALSQLLNPKEIGQQILELLEEKLGWHHTRIRLYHPQDDSLELLDFHQPGLADKTEWHDVVERFQTLITRSDQGMSGWVIKYGQSVRSGDVSHDSRYIEAYPGIRSGLYVPMKLGERMIGVIGTESEQPDAFSETDERLLTTLANQAASAFENARLFETSRQRVMELETLNHISLILRAVSKQDEMLAIVLDEALAILHTSHGSIELWDEDDDILQKKVVRGWCAQVIESPQNSGEGIVGRVIASGEIHVSREFASDPMTRAESRSQIPPGWGGACLPIRTAQQTLGVLIVSVLSERELNRDEIRLLSTLAEMTGSALHRMRLFDETARRAEEFASLYETSNSFSAEKELDSLLKTIVEHARALLHAASSGIYLYDKEREELEVVVEAGNTSYSTPGIRLRLGEGATGLVAQTRQPLRVDDYSTWEGRSEKYAGIPYHALLEVPMLYGGELVGVLTVDEIGDSERKFSEADERLLSLFASQAAGAIHSARLHEETVHRLEHLQALHAVDQAIASSLDMRLTLNIILTHTLPQLGVDAADVLLLHPGSNLLEFTSGRGFRTRLLEDVTVSESFAGRAVMEHRTITVFDIETAEQNPQFGKLWKEEGFSAYWCVPLIVKGEARGVLEVYRRTAFTPDPEWFEFLEMLAGQAAIAIENAQLFENLQRANTDLILAYNATIEGWSRALDLRDKETEGHTQRVADWTVAIAKAMCVKDQGILHVWRGALLHDIGKMGIPDQILLKPGKLTDEEWVIMRTHPQLARDLLMPIAYLREALDIPYCHHEKWDGTGYPQGLKGQQIPLTARFFAVVDVWDALTSDRPYRKKWTKKKALNYIHEQRGRHFDPQVVDAFVKVVKVK